MLLKYGSSVSKMFAAVPPQAKFHMKLKSNGYCPRNYSSKRSGYSNTPTEHQLVSYGSKILDVVKRNDVSEFRKMMEAGLSPNACNQHGESLLHMAARHGKADLFNIMLAYDVDLAQCDDYGRTPLHDACWASNPSFDIAKSLIQCHPDLLFLFDARGSLPLSYVTKPLWAEWNSFLNEILDEAFPKNNPVKDQMPLFCTMKPDTRPVPDPKNKIPAHVAQQVAMGSMAPYEAIMRMSEDEDTVQCTEYDSDSSCSSSYEDYEDSEIDMDDELFHIVGVSDQPGLNTIRE